MIQQSSIDDLKLMAKISDFIDLKDKGSNKTCLCPFHNEYSPSFTVPKADNFYKCFGCGKSGDIYSFITEYKSCNFIDAVRIVAEKYSYDLNEETKDYSKPIQRLEKIDTKFIEYFENRGISNNTLLRFGISQSTEWMPKANKEVKTICFNYYRDGELINIKYRAAQKDFKLDKNAELIFYNLDAIKNEKTCIIVEGEIDCLSMYEAGIYNVVSVPNGASVKGTINLKYLDNCIEYFYQMESITIAADNDETGNRLKLELARRLGKERCKFIDYPENCKDANDILKLYGTEKLNSIVNSAKEFPIDGIVPHEDIEKDMLNFYRNGYPVGVPVQIQGFEEYLHLADGQMTVITGAPGSGKSEFVDFIMATTAIQSGWKWGICSFENTPAALHATKIAEKITGKAFDFRKDPLNRITEFELELALPFIGSNFHFINTADTDITIDGIMAKTAELVARKGIKGLLIDPWNYIEHKIPAGHTETQYISEALTKIKQAAIKLGIHIFIIAHPAKLQKDKSTGVYEVPTLYSISGSAHFYNKTDNGMTIYRDMEKNIVSVHVQKVRFSWNGKIGRIDYNYNTLTRQYQYIEQTG
jgi:twinkle protein